MRRVGISVTSICLCLAVASLASAQVTGPILVLLPRPPVACSAASTLGLGPDRAPPARQAPGLGHVLNVQAAQAVQAGLLATRPEDRRHHFLDARQHAWGASGLDRHDLQARYWLAASIGLLTERQSVREQLRLGRQSYELAASILREDADHPGAHHILGRFNAAVMRLGGVARFIAGRLLGSELVRRASWEAAEAHLLRAAENEPHRPQHRIELARLYADTDRPHLAREQLDLALDTGGSAATDRVFHSEARALLVAIDRND